MSNTRGRIRTVAVVSLLLLFAAPCGTAFGQTVRQITNVLTSAPGPGALDDAGTRVFCGSSSDQFGVNPTHAFQVLRFDAATGAGLSLTQREDGLTPLVSISDDGQWLAFPAIADLTGENHDQSAELFVMRSDGTLPEQLTNDPAVNAGSVGAVALSGSANRIAFSANTDPLGSNPLHRDQLFVINRDGSGLRQLTQAAAGSLGSFGISDDGSRIAFTHSGDLAGANADLSPELFAINADGTGLRQLTSQVGFTCTAPALSGNGQKIAFQSNANLATNNAENYDEVFVIDWTGTGLRQLSNTSNLLLTPASQLPSITDDGLTVVYHSNHSAIFPPLNLDGNFEIFRIKTDGTGLKTLTSSTLLTAGALYPTIAGGGGRVTYYSFDNPDGGNADGGPELFVMDGNGGTVRRLTATWQAFQADADLSADGSRAVYVFTEGLLGTGRLYSVSAPGGDAAPVGGSNAGAVAAPSIAGDAQTIVYAGSGDPLGSNGDGSTEIFLVRVDGSGLRQLTFGGADTSCGNPVIADGGAVVAFDCDANLAGGNADGSREVFSVRSDASNLVQLTSAPVGRASQLPRTDAAGTWAVFESNADLDGGNPDAGWEIYRVLTAGGGLERLTSDPARSSRTPDISADGGRIVFGSNADSLGTNPELNAELFAYDVAGATLRQLTATAEGSSTGPRISGNGAYVYFTSNAPFGESDPDVPADLYRVAAAGGPVQRVGGLRFGAPVSMISALVGGGAAGAAPDHSGDRAVFAGFGDATGHNRDQLQELWLVDRAAQPAIRVSRELPTVVSWDVESGPLRYDLVRGEAGALSGAPGAADLGAVVCLENDSPDADSASGPDPVAPAAGHVFFYVYRGSEGLLAGPGSYGRSTSGAERQPASGDCSM
ncbi:MAG: PD40 domain-containing protein [Acidobacteria bacterium]|nr:PD40 domain-containing protein [Acidobacteriota bacterium]